MSHISSSSDQRVVIDHLCSFRESQAGVEPSWTDVSVTDSMPLQQLVLTWCLAPFVPSMFSVHHCILRSFYFHRFYRS